MFANATTKEMVAGKSRMKAYAKVGQASDLPLRLIRILPRVAFDEEAILKAARETGRIITVEEHSKFGGLGAMVCETISEKPVPVRILGIPDENVVHGTNTEIFHHYGLDAEGVVKAAVSFLNEK